MVKPSDRDTTMPYDVLKNVSDTTSSLNKSERSANMFFRIEHLIGASYKMKMISRPSLRLGLDRSNSMPWRAKSMNKHETKLPWIFASERAMSPARM